MSENKTLVMEERRQIPADLAWLIDKPAFRRWMLRLTQRSGIFASTFGADSRTTEYLDGRRSLGLELLNELAAIEPQALVRILSEPISTPREPKHDRHRDRNPYPDPDAGDDDSASA
jgi:hypothetical protein